MRDPAGGLTLRLAWRAIRWRAAASATVFVVAVIAIFAATVGPIYLRSVDEVVLANHLRDAGRYERDVLISRTSTLGYQGVDWAAEVHRLAARFSHNPLFAQPLSEDQVPVNYSGLEPLRSELAYVEDLCAHVRIVSGRCLSSGDVNATLISANTARAEHLAVGGTLQATATTGPTIPLRVIGVYEPIAQNGPFWEPWYLFQFGQPASPTSNAPGDASFVTASTLSSRVQKVLETFSENVALLPANVGYSNIAGLRATIAGADRTVAHFSARDGTQGEPSATMTTGLPGILDQAAKESSLTRTLVTVATGQLALLAIFLLYAVVANTTAAQGPEVALAKLRGRRSASVLLQSVAQPVTLVLAAAPVAAVLAWLVVRLLAARVLGQPVHVGFPPAAFAVAALGALAGVLAAVTAARRIAVTPVAALMRLGAGISASPVGLLVADAAAVTLALAGLIELKAGGVLNSGKPNPLSVLAPTLLAVAAAVAALRMLPLLGSRLTRWTRDSSHVATFLAVRQMLRRPAEARTVLLVAVAVSIAVFAVAIWSDSRHNRSLRALNSAGAHTVLVVRPGAGVEDLRTAVDRADPGGHSMAVARTSYSDLPPLIAVDTARFAGVAAWVPSNSTVALPTLLRRLADPASPVSFAGTHLRLRVALSRRPAGSLQLSLTVSEPDHGDVQLKLARITSSRGSYVLKLPAACAGGCELTALTLASNASGYSSGQADVIDATIAASAQTASGGWSTVASLAQPRRWREDGSGAIKFAQAGSALSLSVREIPGYEWPAAVSAAIPSAIPAVVGAVRAADEPGTQIQNIEVVGLDRSAVFVDGLIRAVTLPQIDRGGVMIDFGTALALMHHRSAHSTQYQVWLSPQAPENMVARLRRQHVYVERTIRAAGYQAVLDHSGPAFADSLFLLAALAATVLAIGAMAVGRVLSVRRRGYELAALEAVGIGPRTLRRATVAEQGSVFAIGLLVGLAAGAAGSALALPSTPVFVATTTGPPLVLGLPWALLALVMLAMVVVFVVASFAIAIVVERAATPTQLRGAQQ